MAAAAGYIASGEWNVDRESASSVLVRAMGQMISELYRHDISFRHTKSHTGDPGNVLIMR